MHIGIKCAAGDRVAKARNVIQEQVADASQLETVISRIQIESKHPTPAKCMPRQSSKRPY